MKQFPQASEYFFRAVSNFFQKAVEIFAAQGAPHMSLTPGNGISSIRKVLINSLEKNLEQKI
jgi:hypothetical protein